MKQDKEDEIEIKDKVTVPDIRNMNLKDAKKTLKDEGLEIQLNIDDSNQNLIEEKTIIVDQTPKPGIIVDRGANIICNI